MIFLANRLTSVLSIISLFSPLSARNTPMATDLKIKQKKEENSQSLMQADVGLNPENLKPEYTQ